MTNSAEKPLPPGWKRVTLGDVCEVILGQSPPGSTYRNTPEGLPFYQGKADFGDTSPTPRVWCVAPKKIAEAGDILISVRAPVGPTNVASERCAIGRGLAILRAGDHVDKDFLLAYLRKFESNISEIGSGSTFTAITGKQLIALTVPLPPLPEQRRIIALLDQQMALAEKARLAAEEMLQNISSLKSAFLREILPLGQNLPSGWKWVKLGEIIKGKPQYGSGARRVFYDGTVRYVRITDISDSGELKYDEVVSPSVVEPDLFLEPDDLLIARTGSVGRTYIHKDLPSVHQYAGYLIRFRIDPGKAIPQYAYQVTKSDYWKEWIIDSSKTGTLTNINAKQYSSFQLPLPPLPEQCRLVSKLERENTAAGRAEALARQQLADIKAIPAALLREVFAGAV